MKTCKICKVDKADVEFYKNGQRLRPECKSCTDLKQAAARFGMTVNDLMRMYKDQDGRCAICGKECNVYRNLSVDHDHNCCPDRGTSCGKCVRGLLCALCNHGIGSMKDNVDILRKAIEYLEQYQ